MWRQQDKGVNFQNPNKHYYNYYFEVEGQLLTHDDTLLILTTFTDALITTVTTVIICITEIIQRYTPSIGTGEL